MEKRKLIESEHFDRSARSVDLSSITCAPIKASSSFNMAVAAPYEYAETWLEKNCGGKKILDYACGAGAYSFYPIACGADEVVGIDISEESLNVARCRAKNFPEIASKAVFRHCDCESLDFPDNSFDVVFSFGNLSYLDLDKAFAEIARVLKPSGKFLVVDTLGHNPLLNFKRWLNFRKGKRSEFMLSHIVKMSDIKLTMKYFDRMDELKFFDLTTLLATSLSAKFIHLLRGVDKMLLKLPIIKYLAFKVVFVLSNPKKT